MNANTLRASQVALVVKNLPVNAGAIRDVGLIPGWGRSPGEEHGNTLQYSCLENSMDGGAWWFTVCGVAESHMTEQLTLSHSLPVQAPTAHCTIGQ